jgi:hypothetical protein
MVPTTKKPKHFVPYRIISRRVLRWVIPKTMEAKREKTKAALKWESWMVTLYSFFPMAMS